MDNNDKRMRTVTAVERDGLDTRILVLNLRVLADEPEKFDVRQAVMDACTEYVQTDEGRQAYAYNCGCFNWADFEMHVPNDICRRHGFERMESGTADLEVNWDEHLVDDSELEDEEDEE